MVLTAVHLRQQILWETARILAEGTASSWLVAKKKALARLALPASTPLPRNQEVESTLQEYLKIFHRESSASQKKQMGEIASEIVSVLNPHHPRITGDMAEDLVTRDSAITIHVIADIPEEVSASLERHGIPYKNRDYRVQVSNMNYVTRPGFRLVVDNTHVDICVFTTKQSRQAPISPATGKATRYLSPAQLESLLAD